MKLLKVGLTRKLDRGDYFEIQATFLRMNQALADAQKASLSAQQERSRQIAICKKHGLDPVGAYEQDDATCTLTRVK